MASTLSNGILFNHESPIRGETFVTRKITRSRRQHPDRPRRNVCIWEISTAKRDWGHARDYVEGMHRMICRSDASRTIIVLATGETHSVREFVEIAFAEVGRTS